MWRLSTNYDGMHVLAGVLDDSFLGILRGDRWKKNVGRAGADAVGTLALLTECCFGI